MAELEQNGFKLADSIFVIFGITGDLAKRKLLPALYELVSMDLIPGQFKIVGTTRRETQTSDVLDSISKTMVEYGKTTDPLILNKLGQMITMVNMDIGKQEDYGLLKSSLESIDADFGVQLNRLFYLAVPPQMFETIVNNLGSHNLQFCEKNDNAEARLLIEKPFGSNTETAVKLIEQMERVFSEKSIYRVDHYLAKETTQNILTFRLNNPLFKAVWSNRTISHLMITASESLSIEGRVNFYEETGALRDLIQSHLLQLLALTAMEEPENRTADAIHAAKLALLKSIEPIENDRVKTCTVRGQYDTYKEEVNNPESNTETYAAIRLNINNDRWRGVPVLLRTGKGMSEKVTEITLAFNPTDDHSDDVNLLTIRIQPNEGIILSILAKKPSLNSETEMVHMKFFYNQTFNEAQPDAYERVLVDAIRGDKTLFTTDEEVLASWKIIENVLNVWEENGDDLEIYKSGSWGPKSADLLAENSGAKWLTAYMPHDTVTP